jgi:pimeloyl-ACP methyl ester carboxylesterase
MARPILMPQVGQDLTEGKIVALHVKLGDVVNKGDIVADVESEKATFEVEAFERGTVVELNFKVGDMATVLQPLMMVGEPGEVVATVTVAAKQEVTTAVQAGRPETASLRHAGSKAGSSPLARRLASKAGLDISSLVGTGPGGAVVKSDVENFKGITQSASAAVSNASGIRTLQSGSGDPVVFIHGFGTDLSSWRPFVLQLGLSNPALAFDLPAHGANGNTGAHDFASLVAAVSALISKAGLDRFHLVGHSLGAAVAANLAAHTRGARSLTLISPAGLGPRINSDYIEGFLAARSEPALKIWLELLVHNPATLTGALVRATFAARESAVLVENQRSLASGLFENGTQLFSILAALETFAGPTRLIAGAADRIIPAELGSTVPAHVALNLLPQVGHLPQLEAVALTARLVAETVRSAG